MKEITLPMKEQEKLAIIIRYSNGIITGEEASRQLDVSIRQVQHKKRAYLEEGISSIIHNGIMTLSIFYCTISDFKY